MNESFSLAAVALSPGRGSVEGGGWAGTLGTASDGKWEWLRRVDLLGCGRLKHTPSGIFNCLNG